MTHNTHEQKPVSSKETFPSAPFPRKHVHCVVDSLHDAVQAVYTLRTAGYDARHIHVMSCWDFVAAAEQKYRQRSALSKLFAYCYSFLDEGFGDVYLREAHHKRHILVVRLFSPHQMYHVRDILLSHRADRIKYVDTWTVADLTTSREDALTFW